MHCKCALSRSLRTPHRRLASGVTYTDQRYVTPAAARTDLLTAVALDGVVEQGKGGVEHAGFGGCAALLMTASRHQLHHQNDLKEYNAAKCASNEQVQR